MNVTDDYNNITLNNYINIKNDFNNSSLSNCTDGGFNIDENIPSLFFTISLGISF